jgi:hypothetical protein
MGLGGTSGCVVTVGSSGMHDILRCTADILLPCGLHAGPILLPWHINDLKGPMMVYDYLIYLYATLKDAANDVCGYILLKYCLLH